MTKVGFVIKGYSGLSKYYNANVKPFVDISYGLQSIGEEAVLFIDESEKHLDQKIRTITGNNIPIIYFKISNIAQLIKENLVKYIIVDDDIELMKLILNFKGRGIKKGVYVQYLFGVNTNKNAKRKKSVELMIGSYLPWTLLVRRYKELLIQFDYIISNSQTCGYILKHFYDINSSGTVYPPVGTDIRPLLGSERYIKEGVLVFAGNSENDFFIRNIYNEVTTLKKEINEPIKVFVSNPETSKFFLDRGIEVYSNLTIEELIKLYEGARVTYVPTEYELFGHVGAESLLCGTRVILDVYHPFLEMFPMKTKAVKIANYKLSIHKVVSDFVLENVDLISASKAIFSLYSPEESARALINLIKI